METKAQKYYRNNPEKRKKFSRDYDRKFREAIFDILGRICFKCKFEDMRALQVDHINGGGRKQKKIIKGNRNKFILQDLISNPNKYQILCANCNWIKKEMNSENKK